MDPVFPEPKPIPQKFSSSVLNAADAIQLPNQAMEGRRTITVVPIDDPRAKVKEDGYHLEADTTVGVSVVDPSVIPPDSRVVQEALARGSSYRFIEDFKPLLPPSLTRKQLSLVPEPCSLSPALTIALDIDTDQSTVIYRDIFPSSASVQQQLSFKDAEKILKNSSEPHFHLIKLMKLVARALIDQKRCLSLSELFGTLDSASAGKSKLVLNVQRIVEGWMRLYNEVATRIARERGVPILYSNQSVEPRNRRERELIDQFEGSSTNSEVLKELRTISDELVLRSSYSSIPTGHFGMNSAAFASFTQPLHWFSTFVNVSNLSASVRDQPFPFPQQYVDALGPYLNKAHAARRVAQRRQIAVLFKDELMHGSAADMSRVKPAKFRAFVEAAARMDTPPQRLMEELRNRLDQGRFDEPQDQVILAGVPSPGAAAWREPRELLMQRLTPDRARLLLRMARRHIDGWEDSQVVLHEVDQGWQVWTTARISNREYTLPKRYQLVSANAAVRRAPVLFWSSFFDGSIIEAAEPPIAAVEQIPVQCDIPDEFPLPEQISTQLGSTCYG